MIMPRWARRRPSGLTLVREVHYAMGTLLDVRLYHAEPDLGLAILREACREARRLEGLLSRHLPGSELSRLNAHAGQGLHVVSPELFDLLAAAQRCVPWTRGAFDPTVGAVLDLWREAASRGEPPGEDRVRGALRAGGWARVRLIPPRWVELTAGGMSLDLGGIGKGYAVDRMGGLLRERGVRHALINFGESSLLAIGPMPDGRPWSILVRGLEGAPEAGSIEVRDQALGSSASFGRLYSLGGKPRSHVVDPRRGQPLEKAVAVTVVAPTATMAEALSTAFLIQVAAGEAVPILPPAVSAFRVGCGSELSPLGSASGHA